MNKKKIAPVVKDTDIKEPEQPTETDTPAVPVETKPLTVEDKVNLLIEAQKISDQNFKTISEFMTKIEPLVGVAQQIQEQKQMQEANPQPQKAPGPLGGVDLGGVLSVLGPILGQANASNPIGDELMKKVLEAGLSQMTAGTQLLDAPLNLILLEVPRAYSLNRQIP